MSKEMTDRKLAVEVLELTLAVQQGTATDDERARLERLLADSDEARRRYIGVVDDSVTLAETAKSDSATSATASSGAAAKTPPDVGGNSRQATNDSGVIGFLGLARRALQTRPSYGFGLAAILLVAITWLGAQLLIGPSRHLATASRSPLARVISQSAVKWQQGAKRFGEWSSLAAGDVLRFDSGMVELVIDEDVQVLLEGPSDFELVSASKAIARQGKMVVRVGPKGIGFEVETPHANVVDRGTSFGINISPDEQTDVVVYEGVVDLSIRSTVGHHNPRRLATGEGLRVGTYGALGRIVSVDDERFLPPPRLGTVSVQRPRVIRSVFDNVSLSDTAKFYRIVGGGLEEDCSAYVDRLHEWNGMDEHGIPEFLRGADYVKTFNDDKVAANLRITVELSGPAKLYLLWDDRISVPEWVRREFRDTDQDIGLDEGFQAPGLDTSRVTDMGAGASVDRVFSIWQRNVPGATTVVLGSMRIDATTLTPRQVAASMYGIAAVPWVQEQGLRN